jgi:predicted metalloprotease with PDZ domain
VLSARGDSVGELARSLRTESDLSVAQGVVLRLDLDKAIRTRGKERDGQTPLDSLTGHLQTQNTENGTRFTYTQLKAKAGKYTASGEAVIWQKQVDANGTLDIVDGLVGVPFTIKGPVQKPDVKVPPGFFAGAAIGTAVLPGVGTVIGARIGGAIGRIFGNDKKKE